MWYGECDVQPNAHLRTHVLQGGWESRLCVDRAISPVRGSRACFLNALNSDLQARFAKGNWVNTDSLPDFPEASSWSCERVFRYMTQADTGQPTHFMSDNLLVRCNGAPFPPPPPQVQRPVTAVAECSFNMMWTVRCAKP